MEVRLRKLTYVLLTYVRLHHYVLPATPARGVGQEADRADHAAVAGTAANQSAPTDAYPAEQRQEEGIWIAAAVSPAATAVDSAVAAHAETIRGPPRHGHSTLDAPSGTR